MDRAPDTGAIAMLKTICLLMIATSLATAAEDFRTTLTSAERGVRLDHWKITSRALKIKSAAPWSVEKLTLHGGKQEGVDVIVVDNGRLKFTVVPTRGMGVLKVEMGD